MTARATVEALRLTRRTYAASALSGEGARRFGGRWGSPGRRIVYASESLALAVLEVLVHAARPSDLAGYVGLRLTFEEALVVDVVEAYGPLPEHWRDNGWPAEVRAVGDAWLAEGRSAVLRVPSAVLPSAHDYLLNPDHPDAGRVAHEVIEVGLDPRLYRLGEGG